MESGSELSKTVATFILQKILLDDSGLSYICQTYDRFSHVAIILVSPSSSGSYRRESNASVCRFRGKWWYTWRRSNRLGCLSTSSAAIYVYQIILGKTVVKLSGNFDSINPSVLFCRAREALRQCLPDQLRDATFTACLQEDKSTKHWLSLLMKNLDSGATVTDPRQIGISPLTS